MARGREPTGTEAVETPAEDSGPADKKHGPRDVVIDALAAVHVRYGRQVALNPDLLRSLLNEELDDPKRYRRQVEALVAASAAGTVSRMIFTPRQAENPDEEIARVASEGVQTGDARWAVSTWTQTLEPPRAPEAAPVAPQDQEATRPRPIQTDAPVTAPTSPGRRRRRRRRARRRVAAVLGATALALALIAVGLVVWNPSWSPVDRDAIERRIPGLSTDPNGGTDATSERDPATTGRDTGTGAATTEEYGGPEAPEVAGEGLVNTPRAGSYVYDYSGNTRTPPDPSLQPFSGTQRTAVSHQGEVTTQRQSSTERTGTSSTRSVWTEEGTRLVSFEIEVPDAAGFRCTFEPALTTLEFPLQARTSPTQPLSGTGNFCEGSLDVEVVGQETVDDAGGRSWDTWLIRTRLQASGDGFSLDQNQTRWLSPELGMDVRTETTSISTVSNEEASLSATRQATSVLRSWP